MSLSQNARDVLIVAMANRRYANELADAIDSGDNSAALAAAAVADAKAVVADGKAVTADGKAVAADGKAVTALARQAATQAAIPALVLIPGAIGDAADKDDLDIVATKVNDVIAALKAAGLML